MKIFIAHSSEPKKQSSSEDTQFTFLFILIQNRETQQILTFERLVHDIFSSIDESDVSMDFNQLINKSFQSVTITSMIVMMIYLLQMKRKTVCLGLS